VGSMMLVEAITVVSGEMSILQRHFYVVTKLIFIHPTTNFYVMSAQNTFLRILTIVSMHPMGHHVPDSNFKFMNLKFSKTYSKWILNHAQKCQKFNGENCF
jgi:hypothetical protein